MKYKQISIPFTTHMQFKAMSDVRNIKAYRRDEIHILKTEDNTPKWGWLKHVSISCEHRYPTWEEILSAKEHFFGDIDCMMIMPKKEDYVNLHPNCFHIWQTPQAWELQ